MATLRGERLRRDPAFSPLKDAVIALTGLAYWCDKDEMLADLLASLVEKQGAAALVDRLFNESGFGPSSEAVIDAVTVGETSFFRYKAQFDALEHEVIPEMIERNRMIRSLALWSAGCSNGAETYSLAMLLRRRFGAQLAGWRVEILGTDINPSALLKARHGEYGAWTIRDLPPDEQRECFTVHGGLWRVKPAYRQGVRFARHNLISQPPPADHFDVVLCRNVLMYFDAESRTQVLEKLHASLVEGGWLLVGHAEVGPPVDRFFVPRVLPGCTLYRRLDFTRYLDFAR